MKVTQDDQIQPIATTDGQTIEVSQFDKREYDALTLPNGLKVLLVSDPQVDEGAAVMQVDAGSFHEPNKFPGLAHYLEHVLFLGTTKYPNKSEYSKFMADHGGSDNAFTQDYHTVFFFNVLEEHFTEGLDRFAAFFTSPLFSKQYLEKERNAVDSEFQMHQKNDSAAMFSVDSVTSNPAHPFHRFSIGNLESLKDHPDEKLEDAVKNFYYTHYSADKMTLTLVSQHSIEELRALANVYFSAVPKRETKPYKETTLPFTDKEKGILLNLKPHGEHEMLMLEFPFEDMQHSPVSRPIDYFNLLFNDTGPGSLNNYLMQKGWALGCAFAPRSVSKRQSALCFNISLTALGMENIDNVIATVFRFIEFHKNQPASDVHYQQIIDIDTRTFIYSDQKDPLDTALELTMNTREYPIKHVLNGNYLAPGSEIPRARIAELLSKMSYDNLRCTIMSPRVETNRIEPFYKIPYACEDIPASRIKLWNALELDAEFSLPTTNPFIPSDFSIKPIGLKRKDTPDLIEINPRTVLWHLQHNDFGLPKTSIQCHINPKDSPKTLHAKLIRDCYATLLSMMLQRFESDWENAGLEAGASFSGHNLIISIEGFSDKLDQVLYTIQDHLSLKGVDEGLLEDIKTNLQQGLQSKLVKTPVKQLFSAEAMLKTAEAWPIAQQIQEIEKITLDEVLSFAAHLQETSKFEFSVIGNTNVVDAALMAQRFCKRAPATDINYQHDKALMDQLYYPDGVHTIPIKMAHNDQALIRTYQVKDASYRDSAMLIMLEKIAHPLFFEHLRTEAQLGYIVGCNAKTLPEHAGLTFYVNSPNADSHSIHTHVERFTKEVLPATLALMPADAFKGMQGNFADELTNEPLSLGELSSVVSVHLRGDYDFDRVKHIVKELKNISKYDLMNFYSKLVFQNPAQVNLCTPPTSGELPGTMSNTPEDFKQELLQAPSILQLGKRKYEEAKDCSQAKKRKYKDERAFDDDIVIDEETHTIHSRNRNVSS